ncbi:hypothetical protein VTN00DRAFT_2388 [Thermoascus crustaceus]|uniref:uncharacterized protein n=1 Tax=Thermoascus crustaceus TaxID=5088 RepID=UPI00374487FB
MAETGLRINILIVQNLVKLGAFYDGASDLVEKLLGRPLLIFLAALAASVFRLAGVALRYRGPYIEIWLEILDSRLHRAWTVMYPKDGLNKNKRSLGTKWRSTGLFVREGMVKREMIDSAGLPSHMGIPAPRPTARFPERQLNRPMSNLSAMNEIAALLF